MIDLIRLLSKEVDALSLFKLYMVAQTWWYIAYLDERTAQNLISTFLTRVWMAFS
jgi:hypothetical protein